MITREQVADLREGDVVEIRHVDFPDVVTRGPLHRVADGTDSLGLGYSVIRYASGGVPHNADRLTLTVVSRAPRPLYVNHPRSGEPCIGDVVGDADRESGRTWAAGLGIWRRTTSGVVYERHELPTRLRLLVDGETGQVVP